jgi:hypothetical protein
MVYKALEGIQEDTNLSMEDVLIPMYESMGSEMLNINFRGMSEQMLTELSKVISGMDPEEITFEAILQGDISD